MTYIDIEGARRRLAEIAAAAAQGEEFTITIEGVAAALITAADPLVPALQSPSNSRPKFGRARNAFVLRDEFDYPVELFDSPRPE